MKNLIKTLLVMFILIEPVVQGSLKAQMIGDSIGWGMNALPSVAFDADKGFQYGALVKILDYGDPSIKPLYWHMLYAEWAHTTKGNDLKQLKYDSEHLIPGVRLTGIIRLEKEKAMDFYGFNGYESYYNHDLEDENHPDYISRMYYRMKYRSLRVKADFQGSIMERKLRWYLGLAHYNIKASTIDYDQFENIPEVPGLFDEYVSQGIIPEDQVDGGYSNIVKVGLVADTRDFEASPTSGIWTEAYLAASPGFIGNKFPYAGLVVTHRQYLPLIQNRLTFAYRLNYQTVLSGSAPWYILSFKPDTFTLQWEGLGGNKTLRGILRNRVVGEGAILGNFELRWKFLNFNFLGNRSYLTLSSFLDAAKITRQYSNQPNMTGAEDRLHLSYGGGLHFGISSNFILAFDYGIAADPRDGKSGTYIGIDFLF